MQFTFGEFIVITPTVINACRIMKIVAFLLVVFCLHAGARGYSQGITMSFKNTRLERIFEEIERQSGYKFVYKVEILNESKPIDIDVQSLPLKKVLDYCFRDQPLSYTIIDNVIVVSKKERIESQSSLAANNTIDVRGTVMDEKGEPISGASVSVKGTNNLTTTNDKGEFFLAAVEANAELLISHISFQSKEIRLGGKSQVAILLQLKIGELNAVTFKTGIQTLGPNETSGSFQHIGNDAINRSTSTDILSRLKGVSQVLFDRTSATDQQIRIRGYSTIFANSKPLVIVDDFPYSGNIDDINPNDVDDITILKDAQAASLWGARSGNGVIVITTKHGKYNQPVSVQFTSNFSIGAKPDLFYDQQFLKSNDFINVETFLFNQGFYNTDIANTTTFPPLSPVVEILAGRKAGMVSASDSAAQIDGLRNLDIRNDYDKYFYQAELRQQYAINLSGGSEKTSYYLSAGYDNNRGNSVGNQLERFTITLHNTWKPIKNLEITSQVGFIQVNSRNNGMTRIVSTGKYTTIYPYAQLADEQGQPLSVIKDYRSSFAQMPPASGLLNWQYYPLNELKLNDNTTRNITDRIALGIKYTLLKGLSAEIKYQYIRTNGQNNNLQNPDSYAARNRINRFSTVINNVAVRRNVPLGSQLTISNSSLVSNFGRGQLAYSRRLNNRHSINSIAGIEVSDTKSDGNSATFYGYDQEIGTSIPVNFDSTYRTYPSNSRAQIPGLPTITPYTLDRFVSYFANLSYIYNSRYTFSASMRSDQSNLFGVNTNQKKVPLWSVGGAWDIGKEEFYRLTAIPSLRFRATYGFNGNVDKSITAQTTALFAPNNINHDPYAVIRSPGNPELRWEKIGMINLGFDFSSKNNVITGSIEYFMKSGVDMIGDATIAANTGFTAVRGNFSSMTGRGWEIQVNTVNIKKRNLRWETNFQFNYATDKVTRNEGVTLEIPGRPVRWIYSYRWGGLDKNGDPVGYVDGALSKDYGTIVSQVSGDRSLYINSGFATPQYFGNIINTILLKNLTFSAVIVYKLDYFFRRSSISYTSLFNNSVGHNDFIKRWQKPGDELFTSVPAMVYPALIDRDGFYSGSEVLVEKGDHVRLLNVRLSYDIDRSSKSKAPFNHIQVYLFANNLGILWRANKQGIDPDAVSGYPEPLTFSFGITAKL